MKIPVKTSIQLQHELDKVTFFYKNQLELNEKLNNELQKSLKWAELRNNQVGQLINALENANNKL